MGGRHAVVSALCVALATPVGGRPVSDEAPAPRPQSRVSVSRETPHLSVTATLSPARVEPGARLSIVIDVVPAPGMHVYAPGSTYRAIAFELTPSALLRAHAPVYPEPTRYLFKPLNEEVLVYARPFQLEVDVTGHEAGMRKAREKGQRRLAVSGTLEYQACDDRVCYLPVSIPLKWTIRLE